jgi:hypothetical protein
MVAGGTADMALGIILVLRTTIVRCLRAAVHAAAACRPRAHPFAKFTVNV